MWKFPILSAIVEWIDQLFGYGPGSSGSISYVLSANSVAVGQSFAATGQVVVNGQGVPFLPVKQWSSGPGTNGFQLMGTLTTDANGYFSAAGAPSASMVGSWQSYMTADTPDGQHLVSQTLSFVVTA